MRRGRLRREELRSIKKTIEHVRREKEQIKKERQTSLRLYITIAVIIGAILLAGYFSITGRLILEEKRYDKFSLCVTSRGLTLFGTNDCEYCDYLKSYLGESFEFINYVDCSVSKSACQGIFEYPSWSYNGQYIKGNFTLEEISIITKCVI